MKKNNEKPESISVKKKPPDSKAKKTQPKKNNIPSKRKKKIKSAVIFFHKNISSIYKKRWIDKCIESIKKQTYKDFDVFELNYGESQEKFCENINEKHKYFFYNIPFENHILAMNFIIDEIFSSGYDVVFNTNMDDYFHEQRFEKQIEKIEEGYDLISSNFYYIEEINKEGEEYDHTTLTMKMTDVGDIKMNFDKRHNVIAHPCVCISKNLWDEDLHYNNLIGYEDFDLWKRAINKGKKFFILEDFLLFYRIHKNQVTKNNPDGTQIKSNILIEKIKQFIKNIFKNIKFKRHEKN